MNGNAMIHVDAGRHPWEPASDTTLVREYDRHDFPLAGVLEQGGEQFLFACLQGEMSRGSVWAYVRMDEGDEFHLSLFSGDTLIDAIDNMFTDRMITVVGVGDLCILYGTDLDAGKEGADGIVGRFLRRWGNVIKKQQDVVASVEADTTLVCH